MSMNNVFFGNSGLTSTSANHVANLAKEYVQQIECELNSISLVNCQVQLIGSGERNILQTGWNDVTLQSVEGMVLSISEAKSLIAWLREAIKARDKMLSHLTNLEIHEWVELPDMPKRRKPITKDDVIAGFSVKKRNRMFELETKAAAIGKYIHPDGPFANARKEFMRRQNKKNDVKGEGRDTLLYHYSPSCSERLLEETFFKLQKIHRECQAELNGILHEIEEITKADEIASNAEYATALQERNLKIEELHTQFKEYVLQESRRIRDLKIIIPNDLKEIYDIVNSLGK